MPRIPEETLQQVLAATDIVDLVGRCVKLRRAGSNYSGLCPFHNEKTPSFNVSPSRQSFHCFGCGAGGDAFKFVMQHDGLSFVEAVKRLADAAGIRIQEEVWDANAERDAKVRTAMKRAHKELAEWFHLLLMRHQCADGARQYLRSRGMSADVARNWQLGFAPPMSGMFHEWARERGFHEDMLVDAGILKRGDPDSGRRGAYPYFRNRLMIPIRNDNGEVIGFSGRLLDKEAKAVKYLNTPESPLFSKSKVLFGFDKSKRAISKASQAVIVEGQIDMITVFEAGFENVVASQGTAFTELHARMLKRHTDEVVLCFDSDNAGYKAAERAFQILAPTGLIIKVATLPKGDDPDSLIRGKGREAFAELLGGAKEFIDYQIERNRAAMQGGTMDQARLIEKVVASIALCDNPAALEPLIHRAAAQLGVPEASLRRQVQILARRNTGKNTASNPQPPSGGSAAAALGAMNRNAKLLCQLCIHDAEVLHWLRGAEGFDAVRGAPGMDLLEKLRASSLDFLSTTDWALFLSRLDADTAAVFTMLQSLPCPRGGVEVARQALASLETEFLDMRIQQAQTRLKDPGLTPDTMAEIQRQIIAWRKEYLDRRNRSPDIP
jgi:DNA primase